MKTHAFFTKILYIISALTVGLIFILNFVFNSTVSYDTSETVAIQTHLTKSILFALLIALLFFAVSFLKPYLEKVKELYLFIAFSVLYLAMGIYLVFNVDDPMRADPLFVSQAAKDLLAGVTISFEKGGYMYQYPHQIGLMLYDALLYLFYPHSIVNYLANLGLVIVGNYLIYKISDLIFGSHLANNLSIILSFLFLPNFFFILFAYGNIPGLFLMLFAFYHTLRFCKYHNTLSLVFTVIGACLAVALRKNFIIGAIAIIIYLCLNLLKQFSIKQLVAILCVVVSLIVPLKVLPLAFGVDKTGAPSVLWMAMGTDIDNNVRGAGWYDDSNNQIYSGTGYNAEAAQEIGTQKLKQNLYKMAERPIDTGKFFLKKTVSQWCNPLYQSLWIGPLENLNHHAHTPLLKSLYTGGTAESLLSNALKIYVLALFGLSTVFIVRYYKRFNGWELFFLLLIGGFLFHTIWEGKSQYVYSYFFGLIPFAAFSASKILERINTKTKKKE